MKSYIPQSRRTVAYGHAANHRNLQKFQVSCTEHVQDVNAKLQISSKEVSD